MLPNLVRLSPVSVRPVVWKLYHVTLLSSAQKWQDNVLPLQRKKWEELLRYYCLWYLKEIPDHHLELLFREKFNDSVQKTFANLLVIKTNCVYWWCYSLSSFKTFLHQDLLLKTKRQRWDLWCLYSNKTSSSTGKSEQNHVHVNSTIWPLKLSRIHDNRMT